MTPAVFYNENCGNKSSPPNRTKKALPNHSVRRCQNPNRLNAQTDRQGHPLGCTSLDLSPLQAKRVMWTPVGFSSDAVQVLWVAECKALSSFGQNQTKHLRHSEAQSRVCIWCCQHLNLEPKPQKKHWEVLLLLPDRGRGGQAGGRAVWRRMRSLLGSGGTAPPPGRCGGGLVLQVPGSHPLAPSGPRAPLSGEGAGAGRPVRARHRLQ